MEGRTSRRGKEGQSWDRNTQTDDYGGTRRPKHDSKGRNEGEGRKRGRIRTPPGGVAGKGHTRMRHTGRGRARHAGTRAYVTRTPTLTTTLFDVSRGCRAGVWKEGGQNSTGSASMT